MNGKRAKLLRRLANAISAEPTSYITVQQRDTNGGPCTPRPASLGLDSKGKQIPAPVIFRKEYCDPKTGKRTRVKLPMQDFVYLTTGQEVRLDPDCGRAHYRKLKANYKVAKAQGAA